MGKLATTLAFAVVLFASSLASADYDSAQRAAERGAFDEARRLLADPAIPKWDVRMLRLRAELSRDGLGGPKDAVEAYKFFSLALMSNGDGREQDAAAFERRRLARMMSLQDIRAAEAREVDYVDAAFGAEQRKRRVAELVKALRACGSEASCEAAGKEVLNLGPAAADAIPALEDAMTRDPYWMNREVYGLGLATIGSSSVPVLSRVLLDESQLRAEGPWNVQVAAGALRILGPAASDALPAIVDALERDYGAYGFERTYMKFGPGQSLQEVILDLRRSLSSAFIAVGDAKGEFRPRLMADVDRETDVRTKLVFAVTIGIAYREPKPALDIVAGLLDDKDESLVAFAIGAAGAVGGSADAPASMKRIEDRLTLIARSNGANSAEAKDTLASLTWRDAESAFAEWKNGNAKSALETSDAIIAVNPWTPPAFVVRAEAKIDLADLPGATKDYQSAVALGESAEWLRKAIISASASVGGAGAAHNVAPTQAVASCLRSEPCHSRLKAAVIAHYDESFGSTLH